MSILFTPIKLLSGAHIVINAWPLWGASLLNVMKMKISGNFLLPLIPESDRNSLEAS